MKFTQEQIKLLEKIGVSMTLDGQPADEAEFEEKVGDYLRLSCFDENYNPTHEGQLCEELLDMLA